MQSTVPVVGAACGPDARGAAAASVVAATMERAAAEATTRRRSKGRCLVLAAWSCCNSRGRVARGAPHVRGQCSGRNIGPTWRGAVIGCVRPSLAVRLRSACVGWLVEGGCAGASCWKVMLCTCLTRPSPSDVIWQLEIVVVAAAKGKGASLLTLKDTKIMPLMVLSSLGSAPAPAMLFLESCRRDRGVIPLAPSFLHPGGEGVGSAVRRRLRTVVGAAHRTIPPSGFGGRLMCRRTQAEVPSGVCTRYPPPPISRSCRIELTPGENGPSAHARREGEVAAVPAGWPRVCGRCLRGAWSSSSSRREASAAVAASALSSPPRTHHRGRGGRQCETDDDADDGDCGGDGDSEADHVAMPRIGARERSLCGERGRGGSVFCSQSASCLDPLIEARLAPGTRVAQGMEAGVVGMVFLLRGRAGGASVCFGSWASTVPGEQDRKPPYLW